MSSFTAFGAGKVILLGEHGVVYGQPALAAPLGRGVRATARAAKTCSLEVPPSLSPSHRKLLTAAFARAAKACGRPQVSVSLESDLPISMGLGSSAALAVACARLLLQAAGRRSTPEAVARVAREMELVFHGTPSGVDHTASAQERLILFRRQSGTASSVKAVKSPRPLKLLVALVGERSSTQSIVGSLRERASHWPTRYRRLYGEMGRLATEGARAVEEGDLQALGDLLNLNHGLLSALQLSSLGLDEMVYRLRRMGALGAKLTGAGGDGGAVIGLFLEPEPVVAHLAQEGVRCFGSQIAGPPAL
ncbi:MAG: mevalonate kinase [Myxococcota bacterium]